MLLQARRTWSMPSAAAQPATWPAGAACATAACCQQRRKVTKQGCPFCVPSAIRYCYLWLAVRKHTGLCSLSCTKASGGTAARLSKSVLQLLASTCPAGSSQWALCDANGGVATFSLAPSNCVGAAAAQLTGRHQPGLGVKAVAPAAAGATSMRLLPPAGEQAPFLLLSSRITDEPQLAATSNASASRVSRLRQPAPLSLTSVQLPEASAGGVHSRECRLAARQYWTMPPGSLCGGETPAGGDAVTPQLLAGGDQLAPRLLVQVLFLPSLLCRLFSPFLFPSLLDASEPETPSSCSCTKLINSFLHILRTLDPNA